MKENLNFNETTAPFAFVLHELSNHRLKCAVFQSDSRVLWTSMSLEQSNHTQTCLNLSVGDVGWSWGSIFG